MAININPEVTLTVAVDEQRRVYDELTDAYRQVSIKILTLIGAAFALLTFLYSSGDLFIPKEVYGRIFYFCGLLLTLGSTANLLHATRPNGVKEIPTEIANLSALPDNYTNSLEYIEYIKNRYIICYKINIAAYQNKLFVLSQSFYPLLIGATLLVVLKIFKGTIK